MSSRPATCPFAAHCLNQSAARTKRNEMRERDISRTKLVKTASSQSLTSTPLKRMLAPLRSCGTPSSLPRARRASAAREKADGRLSAPLSGAMVTPTRSRAAAHSSCAHRKGCAAALRAAVRPSPNRDLRPGDGSSTPLTSKVERTSISGSLSGSPSRSMGVVGRSTSSHVRALRRRTCCSSICHALPQTSPARISCARAFLAATSSGPRMYKTVNPRASALTYACSRLATSSSPRLQAFE
mmetsp:Transcript_24168/g.56143  ORF Transcript_24168/g.56143 Transcript_24168/m.56143 type:complete len:241 (-) Transcript_24168:1258-1980(-)